MASFYTHVRCQLFLLAGLLAALAAPAWAQAPAWQAVVAVGPLTASSSAVVSATVADASGNVYVGGTFTGTISLPGATLTSNGPSDVFVAKWVPNTQSFAWVQRSSGTGSETLTALTTSNGRVYLAGYFENSANFTGNALTSAGASDAFVAMLTDAGTSATFQWSQSMGGPDNDQANALAANGIYVYVAGTFMGTAAFGSLSRTSLGLSDGFVANLVDAGASGSFAWVQALGSPGNDYTSGVAVQGFRVYVTGLFAGPMTLGTLSLNSGNLPGLFVARLNETGFNSTFAWAQQAGGTSIVVPNALAVQNTEVYVAGRFQGTATFGSQSVPNATTAGGAYDAFVAKLVDAGPSATWIWAYGAGGPLSDYVNALAVQGSNVYLAGGFGGTAAFGSTTLTSTATSDDVFVTRLTDAGATASFAWAQKAGGSSTDNALALATVGTTVCVGGSVYGTASFGSKSISSVGGGAMGFLTSLADGTGLATAKATAAPLRVAISPTPTPGGTLATVQLPAVSAAGPVTLTVLDAVGRVVRTHTATVAAGSPQATLDVAGLAPGVYALRVAVGERLGTARLVVE